MKYKVIEAIDRNEPNQKENKNMENFIQPGFEAAVKLGFESSYSHKIPKHISNQINRILRNDYIMSAVFSFLFFSFIHLMTRQNRFLSIPQLWTNDISVYRLIHKP